MEPNESHHQQQQHLSSPYFHHHLHNLHHHHHNPTTASSAGATATIASSSATVPSSNNGLLPPPPTNDGSSLVVYPHSVPSSAVTAPMEPAKRKRGRPRKYGTPEQALAAKKMASSASSSSARERREQAAGASNSGSSRKSQLGSVGKTGQSFTPHIVNIAPGEDVAQKIVLFAQQSKHELCVLSASGTISNASLRQPATSGGIVSYEGQYEIISLCGSFVRAELGSKTGGLSVCLSSSDGQIIGGGIGGHLKAAGPVQVILGTFQLDRKKDASSGVKGDASNSGSRFASPSDNTTMLGIGFQSGMESSERHPTMSGNDEQQQHHHAAMSGGHFMMQAPHGMHMAHSRPSVWGTSEHDGRSSAGYDLSGWTGHESSENGDYEQTSV